MWLEYFHSYMENQFPEFLEARPWNYKNDLCMIGAWKLYEATKEEAWLDGIRSAAPYLMDEAGNVKNWKENEHNIDKVSFGKSLRILRDLTQDVRYARGVEKAFSFLDDYPRTETGNYWHKDIYPNQVWLDGLYMAMPFYADCLEENGENRWDDILDQFQSAHRLLWSKEKGLYLHGCDVSRKADWANPQTGCSQSVWSRAQGWFLMALADVYEKARAHTERAGELSELLKQALEGLYPYQAPVSHMYYQVIDLPQLEGNYPETSGSAMIAYAMRKGARLGMVDPIWAERGSRVLDGIRDQYLTEEDGRWHLDGICASAGLGAGPDPHNRKDRSGKPEYYISELQMRDNQHGTAACMMAYSEQLRQP